MDIILTQFNFYKWKKKIEIKLKKLGLHHVTMGLELEPTRVAEKQKK